MNRITTARLDELIADYDWRLTLYETPFMVDVRDSLRELLAYRKAVKEYLEAVDAIVNWRENNYKHPVPEGLRRTRFNEQAEALSNNRRNAEATLRALKERT